MRHIYDYTTYSAKYPKIIVGKDHYFWGYNDQSLFEHALEVTMPIQNEKRLDIFFTGSMHSPFSIAPKVKLYDKKVEKIKGVAGTQKKFVESILFTDDALREFFTNYRKRRDYNHTLFIITGDHPMTELPIKNALKRYHVPLILYSPQLIKPWVFTNVVSHLDIYETLLAFLKPYGVHVPVLSASLGRKLKTDKPAPYTLVFMNSNRVLKDVFTNGYFLSEKNLYKVDSNFNCIPTEDSLLTKKLQAKLKAFEEMNYYVSFKNRIYPNLYGK
ncbi:MAG: sulfatase-like hydrolase/transferase [Bacteroidales bacterium]